MSTTLHELKKVSIVAERLLEDRLIEAVRRLGASGYTAVDVRGEGSRGVRATEFEGHNVKLEVLVSPAVAEAILEHLAKRYFEAYAVVAYVETVQVVRGEKYA
jgi:nitrogen regulatory protein PII